MPTLVDFDPFAAVGVCVTTDATMSIHIDIPIAPTMSRNFLPYLSTVHAAFIVKNMAKVAFRALIKAMVSVLVKTFL